MKAKIINKSWHTRKVVPRTLWWDLEPRTPGLDPMVGPLSLETLLKTFTNRLNPESTMESSYDYVINCNVFWVDSFFLVCCNCLKAWLKVNKPQLCNDNAQNSLQFALRQTEEFFILVFLFFIFIVDKTIDRWLLADFQ